MRRLAPLAPSSARSAGEGRGGTLNPALGQALQETGMRFRAPESVVIAPSNRGASCPTFGAALLVVMPSAQRSQIVVGMVITATNVVYIGRNLFTSDAVVAPGALVAIPAKDALVDSRPVGGKALSPVTSLPLAHAAPHVMPRPRLRREPRGPEASLWGCASRARTSSKG